MVRHFAKTLNDRILAGEAAAVVGLDPRIEALPGDVRAGNEPERILAFYRECLPRLARHVPVVKPNIAFFERYGAAGFGAYEETCRLARSEGLLVIGDIKRGDIGSTAKAYAEGHLPLVDAVTLHPYLGTDSLQPFLDGCRDQGKGIFVLVRTSNPSAEELQAVPTHKGSVSALVAQAVASWGDQTGIGTGSYSPVGAVVGATWPDELAELRRVMPRAIILIPGVGAQGGKVEDLAVAFDKDGLGALISQSRGVMGAFQPGSADWLDQIESAAKAFAAQVRNIAGSQA